MIRLTLTLAALLAAAIAWALWERDRGNDARAALAEARAYTLTRQEIDDAIRNLPADPADVRQRLCALAPAGTC